jgi:hypothetical protein
VATIRQALLREGPVVVAGLVCSNFIPDENGVVPLPDGYIQGGHQYVFCGHLPEKKLFIMRNTWGKDWGIDGYAYMHEDRLFRASDMGYYTMEIWSQTDLIMPKRAKEIRIRPGFYSMLVDGVEIALDQPAFITNANRTVLPVRAIASNAGYLVSWDNDKSEVILTDPSQ